MPLTSPAASWSVLDRRSRTRRPCSLSSGSSASSATSSDRRKPVPFNKSSRLKLPNVCPSRDAQPSFAPSSFRMATHRSQRKPSAGPGSSRGAARCLCDWIAPGRRQGPPPREHASPNGVRWFSTKAVNHRLTRPTLVEPPRDQIVRRQLDQLRNPFPVSPETPMTSLLPAVPRRVSEPVDLLAARDLLCRPLPDINGHRVAPITRPTKESSRAADPHQAPRAGASSILTKVGTRR